MIFNKVVTLGAVMAVMSSAAFAATSPDQKFANAAAQGGLAEVAAGQLAADKGASTDIKSFADTMVQDHTKANAELKDIADREAIALPDEPSAKQKAAADALSKMNGAGFDRAYARQMVKDHTEVAALFRAEAGSGKDPALKAFAGKTLPTIEMHLEMAKKLPSAKHASN